LFDLLNNTIEEEVMRMVLGLLIGVLIVLFGLGIIINVVFHAKYIYRKASCPAYS
jgi:uncharacterized membrane protein